MKHAAYRYSGLTHKGLKRQNNEDDYGQVITAAGALFVVCDGMGGHAGGEIASKKAVETICDYMQSAGENEDVPSRLKSAFAHANSNVYEEAQNNPELSGMGTTCVALFLTNKGEVYLAHVGDSRCYAFNETKELCTLTKDHSHVQFLVEIGDIKQEEAFNHPQKNKILKALGISRKVDIDVTKEPLRPAVGSTFLLCTDGLNDMLRDEEIKNVLAAFEKPEKQAQALVDRALKNGGKDNVTVTVIQITSSLYQKEKNINLKKKKSRKKYLLIALCFLLAVIAAVTAFILMANYGDEAENESGIINTTESATAVNEKLKPVN